MLSSKIPRIQQTPITKAETVSHNDDLLLEIFLRLPIKSLLKFKSVSKHWLSLISNPHFSHNLITFRPFPPSGIFLRRSSADQNRPVYDFINLTLNPSRPPFESLGFVFQRNGIIILQSCNGLFLCCSQGTNFARRDYYIYNPTTKQFTTLPKLQEEEEPRSVFGINLAYNPSKTSTYKAICVTNSDSFMNNYQVDIYSSRTGPWRPCQGVFAAPFSIRFDCGVYWNEAIHWISTEENSLYFDLREEKIHEMPMPPFPEDYEAREVEYFGECGGHLNLIEIYEHENLVFDVYEMQEDRSGWFVKYHVDLHCVSAAFPEIIPKEEDLSFSNFSILSVIRSDVDEESYLVLLIPGKVVRVSVKSMRFEELVDIEEDPRASSAIVPVGFADIDAYLFIESLACV